MTIIKTARTIYTLNCPVCGFDSDPIEDVTKVEGWVIKGNNCFHEECAPRCGLDGCEAFSFEGVFCSKNHEYKHYFYSEEAEKVLVLNKCVIKEYEDKTGWLYIGHYRGEEIYHLLESIEWVISFINGALK